MLEIWLVCENRSANKPITLSDRVMHYGRNIAISVVRVTNHGDIVNKYGLDTLNEYRNNRHKKGYDLKMWWYWPLFVLWICLILLIALFFGWNRIQLYWYMRGLYLLRKLCFFFSQILSKSVTDRSTFGLN